MCKMNTTNVFIKSNRNPCTMFYIKRVLEISIQLDPSLIPFMVPTCKCINKLKINFSIMILFDIIFPCSNN